MVLQGFSWTDFFVTSEWYGTQQSSFDISRIAHAAGGDVSGDGMTDLVYLYRGQDAQSGPEWIHVSRSAGDRFMSPEPWVEISADSLPWDRVGGMDCGDMDDDGFDDTVLLFHPDDESGVLWMFRSDGSTFSLSDTDPEEVRTLLRPSNVAAFGLGDFDADGRAEAVVATLTDSLGASRQSLWVLQPAAGPRVPPEEWLEIPSGDVPLKGILEFHTGDYSGDGQDDVCCIFDDREGALRVKVSVSQGSFFSPAVSWWDTTTAEFPPEDFYGTTSQDLNGDGHTDLLLFYSQENHQLNPQWFVALLSDGSHFYSERWGASAIGNYQFSRQYFPTGGDFNGDGFGEFATLFNRDIPAEDPYQVIRAAVSYGEKFGVPGPSYHESRFMAYDAIIHGATGIVWWGIWHTGGPYAVWRGISEVAGELSTLRSFLVHDDSPHPVTSSTPAIETMLKEVGPYACLIAANRADSTFQAALGGSSIGEYDTFDVMFEDRSLAPDGNTLHDQFDPYDVHVYLAYAGSHSDPWPPAGEVSVCPNPFSSSTLFTLRSAGATTPQVEIYDIRGRRIRRIAGRETHTGLHSLEWDGRNSRGERVPTGVYLCRFKVGDQKFCRKIVCVR
jgi:hypothetical protein